MLENGEQASFSALDLPQTILQESCISPRLLQPTQTSTSPSEDDLDNSSFEESPQSPVSAIELSVPQSVPPTLAVHEPTIVDSRTEESIEMEIETQPRKRGRPRIGSAQAAVCSDQKKDAFISCKRATTRRIKKLCEKPSKCSRDTPREKRELAMMQREFQKEIIDRLGSEGRKLIETFARASNKGEDQISKLCYKY